MEGFGTYSAIQNIAAEAVKEYREKLFKTSDPHEYATNVVKLYRAKSNLNPIRDNEYYRYLVDAYPAVVLAEIIKQISNGQNTCNEK